jgi:hypothetical protein
MRLARLASFGLTCVTSLSLAACGGGGSGDDDDDDDSPDADVTVPPDADNSDFVSLIQRSWSIPPGEQYKCIGVQADQDYYINTFRPLGPTGTHHTVLSISDSLGGFGGLQSGEYDCGAGSLALEMLFASGVGTDDLALPEGVALKIEQGQWIHLNLHLFNTQPSGNLDGTSGILIKAIPEAEVVHEAEMVFAGDGNLNIPANMSPGTTHWESGGCTFDEPATLMAYWPHMHQYATHQRVTLTVNGTEMTLHDEPFAFTDQYNFPLDTPIEVDNGDSIFVECGYFNDTNQAVDFGDSSEQEMCFTGLYRYPKQALHLFECTSSFGGL